MKNFAVKTFVTVFGLGNMPVAPGTWGTFGAFMFWQFYFKYLGIRSYLIILILLTLVAVRLCTVAEKIYRKKDSQNIVVDEFCGYLVGMIGVPLGFFWGLAGFVLFRIFDIFKPKPIRQLEKLPSGQGVMADDLMAGVYTAIILNVASYFISYLLI